MSLGELIKALEAADPNKTVAIGFHNPMSYRGYYDQLAFEPLRDTTVGAMLKEAREALGQTFTGYKGGEYEMHDYTDVWLAYHGCCGEEIGPTLLSFMLGEPKFPEDE